MLAPFSQPHSKLMLAAQDELVVRVALGLHVPVLHGVDARARSVRPRLGHRVIAARAPHGSSLAGGSAPASSPVAYFLSRSTAGICRSTIARTCIAPRVLSWRTVSTKA